MKGKSDMYIYIYSFLYCVWLFVLELAKPDYTSETSTQIHAVSSKRNNCYNYAVVETQGKALMLLMLHPSYVVFVFTISFKTTALMLRYSKGSKLVNKFYQNIQYSVFRLVYPLEKFKKSIFSCIDTAFPV